MSLRIIRAKLPILQMRKPKHKRLRINLLKKVGHRSNSKSLLHTRDFLVVQWLGNLPCNAEDVGSILVREFISHVPWSN